MPTSTKTHEQNVRPALNVEALKYGEGVKIDLGRGSITLSLEDLAACVAELDSNDQALFLVKLANAFSKFKGYMGPTFQAIMVGMELSKMENGHCAISLLNAFLEKANDGLVENIMEE